MPEEQAFGVLMKIMFDYHTRDMFRNGFEELHLKFFQLQKLMEVFCFFILDRCTCFLLGEY